MIKLNAQNRHIICFKDYSMVSINTKSYSTVLKYTCLIGLSLFFVLVAIAPVFAASEEEAGVSDGYVPSEYRLENDAINEWEDRVLIAATGKLKNEGRVYYAYGDYVDELISYFTKEDLDLTEKEAKDAVSEITDPENAKAGAMSGYLYQIGGKPADSDSLVDNGEYDGKVYPEFDITVRFANEEEYRASDLYKNNKAFIEERNDTVYESQSAMREEMKKLAEADRTYQRVLSSRPADASLTEITAPKATGIIFALLAGCLLILTIYLVVYGWRRSTISILTGADDENWNKGNTHRDRHRIRKISAVILAAIVAFDLVVIYSALTFYSTFGSNNYLEKATDESGVCQHCFMSFRNDVHDYLNKNSLPQNALDRALTYRDYKFDYTKGIRSAIKSGSDEVTYRGVQESVESQIDLLAYVTKKDSGNVVKDINKIYESSLSADPGVIIYKLRTSLKGAYIAGFIFSIISLLVASAMLIFERHNIYRGIKDLAIGALAGTGLWTIITVFVIFAGRSKSVGLLDDQAYVMFNSAIGGLPFSMMVLLGISAAVSVLLFGTSWLMHRRG